MRIKNATELKIRNVNLEESFMNLHERNSTAKNKNLTEVYKILDKYGRVDEDVDEVFKRAPLIEQREMVNLLERGNTASSIYVVVVDFDPNNNYLEDNYLLGWNNKYDWFDTDTCGYEILTPKGRLKKYGIVTLDIDRWVGIYIGENQSYMKEYSDDANEEGYNCTVCRLEKDSEGEWIVVPV